MAYYCKNNCGESSMSEPFEENLCDNCWEKENNSKMVYDMLKFQYEPIEKAIKEHQPEMYAKFIKLSYSRKIRVLDNIAQRLAL